MHYLVERPQGSESGAFDSYYLDNTDNNGQYPNGAIAAEVWSSAAGGWIGPGGSWIIIPLTAPLASGSWDMITETVTTGMFQVYVDGSLLGTQALEPGRRTFPPIPRRI